MLTIILILLNTPPYDDEEVHEILHKGVCIQQEDTRLVLMYQRMRLE